MPLHVSSTCAHHQEVKIVNTASGIITPVGVMIPEAVYTILTSYRCDDTRGCVYNSDILMMSTCARNM